MVVFDFNKWLLADSTIATLLDYSDGDDWPILPLQDQPEERGAYMVYDFSRKTERLWLIKEVSLSIECWSYSYDDAVSMEERIMQLVESDQSWQRFQAFVRQELDDHSYSVQELAHQMSADLPPPTQEGGKFGRLCVVTIKYTPSDVEI